MKNGIYIRRSVKMIINQKLTKEDFINLNLHLYKKNRKFKTNILVVGIISTLGAVLSFVDKIIPCRFAVLSDTEDKRRHAHD